jgi:hypothetical protein
MGDVGAMRYAATCRLRRNRPVETDVRADIRPDRPRTLEQRMPSIARAVLALALVTFVAACAAKEEPVYIAEPVQPEPTYTGKYK